MHAYLQVNSTVLKGAYLQVNVHATDYMFMLPSPVWVSVHFHVKQLFARNQ